MMSCKIFTDSHKDKIRKANTKYWRLQDYAWLFDQHLIQHKTQQEIADFIGSSRCPVYLQLKRFNICDPNWANRKNRVQMISRRLKGNKNGFGNKCSQELKERFSKERVGSGNPNWKGVVRTAANRTCMTSWMLLAAKIRKRDNYTCAVCNHTPSYEVHHRVPYNETQDDSEENLITLCERCHPRVESGKINLQICLR